MDGHPSGEQRLRPWERALLAFMKRFGVLTRQERLFFLLVPAVGLASGCISVAITTVIHLIEELLWGEGYHILEAAQRATPAMRVLVPVVGGAGVGLVVLVGRGEIRSGIANLIEAVALRGGYVATARTILTQMAGILTVGCGGSAGREGPLTVSGATFASKTARLLGLSGNPLKILVGCGTAAGMAAAYNAPVGGAIFAMEVVLGNFALDTFGPIVISSVLATLVSRRFLFPNGQSVYEIPSYSLATGWELLSYALLGVLAGGLAVLFIKVVGWSETGFEKLPIVPALKPVLGFALLGGLGLWCPYVYGNGFDTVNLVLQEGFDPSQLGLELFLALPLLKLLATAVTLGSGGTGGLFTPSLFVGALLGSAFGLGVHDLFPGSTSPSGAYALVGMASIAAATTHAPISAILIIFEMTQSYSIILPLMSACIVSNLVSRALKRESIFLDRLARRGVRLPHRFEEIVMESMKASDIAREDPSTLRTTDTLETLIGRFMDSRRNHLYVLDNAGRFAGAVSFHDLKQVLFRYKDLGFILAADVLYADFPHVLASDRLTRVLEAFAHHDFERLPVLEDEESRRFVGFVTKRDVIAVYNQEVLQRPALLARFTTDRDEGEETTFVELPPNYRVDQVAVGSGLAGRTLAALRLPASFHVHVLSLKRLDASLREVRVIPEGTTRLETGDRMVVLGPLDQIEALRQASAGAGASPA